jgi:hypothetical protein
MKPYLFILVLIVAQAVSTANAEVITLGTYGGKTYAYQSTPLDYFAARQEAVDLGGYLVCINDSAENAWLTSVLEPMKASLSRVGWMGLTDPGTGWQWLSGESVTYTNWRPAGVGWPWAEPTGNDVGTLYLNGENGIPTGMWADDWSTGEWSMAVYEGVPEPATLSLMAIGLVGLARRRCRH